MLRTALCVLVLASLVSPAWAQTSAPSSIDRPATISVAGGLSAGASTSGPSVGTTFTFELTRHASFEGNGTFLDRGDGSNALSVNMAVRLNLLPSTSSVVPYAAIGGGLYRASFDLDDRRMFGTLGALVPGSQMVAVHGPGGVVGFQLMRGPSGTTVNAIVIGPTMTPGRMPDFYMNRVGSVNVAMDGRMGPAHVHRSSPHRRRRHRPPREPAALRAA